jgi:hypothetical protein
MNTWLKQMRTTCLTVLIGCHLRRAQFMARIVLCVLHFRLGARYVEANPPFTSIEMDYSDSAREGCAVSTLTILSEPCDWRGAVQVLLPWPCLRDKCIGFVAACT